METIMEEEETEQVNEENSDQVPSAILNLPSFVITDLTIDSSEISQFTQLGIEEHANMGYLDDLSGEKFKNKVNSLTGCGLNNLRHIELVAETNLSEEKYSDYGSIRSHSFTIVEDSGKESKGVKTESPPDRHEIVRLLDSENGGGEDQEDEDGVREIPEDDSEPSWRIALEALFPFILATVDVAMAGLCLERVESWKVFRRIPEVFILVPALLGLRGNIIMTLASRLSTQANLGNMDSSSTQMSMIAGNLALSQVQAVLVGMLAAFSAMAMGWIPKGKFDFSQAVMLCATSVVAASMACLILGVIVVTVVVLSRKCHANPDNVATSLGTSLGDCATLVLLSIIARFFYSCLKNHAWVAPSVLCLLVALTPLWGLIAYRNKHVHHVLFTGWVAIIGGMMISSLGGAILDFTVQEFDDMGYFQPLISGVGGNLAAIQASRLSTSLHKRSTPGRLPRDAVHGCPNPCKTFFGKGPSARTARVLLMFVIPDHLIFLLAITYFKDLSTNSPLFPPVYLLAAFIQVVLLIYLATWLVHFVWKRGGDPDNVTSPFITALGDFLGAALLALSFYIVFKSSRSVPNP